MQQNATLVSPVHSRDFDRFCLQRESIERCGIDFPHVAIVDHEDMSKFRDMPYRQGLTLISTRDVLPRRIERRRCLWGIRRRNPRRWFAKAPIHGWGVQQFIKLAAPDFVSSEAYVCLDSDTLFVGRVTAEDFRDRTTGKPYMYETFDDVDAEMAEWVSRSMRFLGVKPTQLPVSRFTHSPVVMRRDVVLDMQRFIEKQHGRHWMEAMDRFQMIMEYSTYGVYAKYVVGLARVTPSRPALSAYFWWADEVRNIERTFRAKLQSSGAKIVGIQSNMGKSAKDYRHLLEEAWLRWPVDGAAEQCNEGRDLHNLLAR
jgi:hypothetical protein